MREDYLPSCGDNVDPLVRPLQMVIITLINVMTNTRDDSLTGWRVNMAEFTEHAAPIPWTRSAPLRACWKSTECVPLSFEILDQFVLKCTSNNSSCMETGMYFRERPNARYNYFKRYTALNYSVSNKYNTDHFVQIFIRRYFSFIFLNDNDKGHF